MARAEAASASARSDSIKGLAQSIAKPAYRRLLTAEPALRRAVPALIIAFLLTICVGAVVQVLDHRRPTVADLGRTKSIAITVVLADRIDRDRRGGKSDQARSPTVKSERARARNSGLGARGRPPSARHQCRAVSSSSTSAIVLGSNADGPIVAPAPLEAGMIGRHLIDVLGPSQPLTTFGAAAGVREIPSPRRARPLRHPCVIFALATGTWPSSIPAAKRSR